MPEPYDVFISYTCADGEQVRRLAENLHNAGLHVFLDEWESGPGDVIVHHLDAAILNSRNGVLCVTPTALSRPWVQEEYAALLTRAVEKKLRLIPILFADAELPAFLATQRQGPSGIRGFSAASPMAKSSSLTPSRRSAIALSRPSQSSGESPARRYSSRASLCR